MALMLWLVWMTMMMMTLVRRMTHMLLLYCQKCRPQALHVAECFLLDGPPMPAGGHHLLKSLFKQAASQSLQPVLLQHFASWLRQVARLLADVTS
jgi:hypothetical protein